MADSGFKAREKYPGFNEQKTILYNAPALNTATAWFLDNEGCVFLDQNQSAQLATIPITGLRVGDKLRNFRVLGSLGAASGQTTSIDADFIAVTKGAGSVTTASVGAIAQTTAHADTSLDVAKTLSERIVSADYQYFVKLTGTTADNAACDLQITGIEVDVERA